MSGAGDDPAGNDVYQFGPVDFGRAAGWRVLTLRKIMRESPNTPLFFRRYALAVD
jgi:hypothetical protein